MRLSGTPFRGIGWVCPEAPGIHDPHPQKRLPSGRRVR